MHYPGEFPAFQGNWLPQRMNFAEVRGACVRINCSTCGATGFRRAMWIHAANASPQEPEQEVIRQLQLLAVSPPDEPLRLVLYELLCRLGTAGLERISPQFADGPAGATYRRMQAHAHLIETRRRENEYRNSPEFSAALKAERAARHAARIAEKAVRDARRRSATGEPNAPEPAAEP